MEGEESRDVEYSGASNNNKTALNTTNAVWQRWTAKFRASRRMKNDLIMEESIDATVERHMTLMPTKKRSLFDDDSESDDESNYYKLDDPPPQRCHPLEFTPSGYLPILGPQRVTPCDPSALPRCTLRRYGHDDDYGLYDEDRIPPPPSFHRYPSKKRAVGKNRPEPELEQQQQCHYDNHSSAPRSEAEEDSRADRGKGMCDNRCFSDAPGRRAFGTASLKEEHPGENKMDATNLQSAAEDFSSRTLAAVDGTTILERSMASSAEVLPP